MSRGHQSWSRMRSQSVNQRASADDETQITISNVVVGPTDAIRQSIVLRWDDEHIRRSDAHWHAGGPAASWRTRSIE